MNFIPFFQSIRMVLPGKKPEIYGYEALLRGPENSRFESPDVVFQKARLLGRLQEIDLLAFTMSCRTFAANDPGGKLFVNLFPETLLSETFSPTNINIFLQSIGLSPSRVVIEINEAHAEPKVLAKRVEEITRDGIQLALDDFGSGHSDMNRWIELNPAYLKCDQNLIKGVCQNPRRMQAIKSVEMMCQGGSLLIAEGVETQEDLDCLTQNTDIRLFQGFHLGYPAPLSVEQQKFGLSEGKRCTA